MTNSQDAGVAQNRDVWRLQQLALVSQVATQVTSIMDLDELLVRVAGLIYQTFEFYVVSLYTLEKDVLVQRAQAGPAGQFRVEDATVPAHSERIPLGDGIIGWVGQHQQELVVSDVSREQRFRYHPALPRTQAEATLPVKVEDKLLGVLDVQLDDRESFDESDMLVLRALAGQVAMAIEDTRLYAEAKRRGDYLAAISEVSWAAASILDVNELLGQVSELIHKQFAYPYVQLFTINYGRRQIVYRAGSGLRAEALKQKKVHYYRLNDKRGLIPLAARTGESVRADDVTAEPAYRPAEIMPLATRSELAIPLIYNDEVLGVLDVQSDKTGAFSDEDQATMETLAANIAVALRNARLYESERWRYQVADSLRRISSVLITDVDLGSILDSILGELKRNLPVEILAIWLIRNKKLLLCNVQAPAAVKFESDFDPERDPWLARGLAAAEPLLRRRRDPEDPIARQLGYTTAHSAIVAPLRVQTRALGLLTLVHSNTGQYGQEALRVTTAFANPAAFAIENGRLFQMAQEEAHINRALLQVAQAAQGFGALSEVLTAVTEIPSLLAEVKGCAIWLYDGEMGLFEPEAAYGFSPETLFFFQTCRIDKDRVGAAQVLDQVRAPVVVVDAASDPRLPADLVAGLDLRTLVLLPLIAHDDLLGLMLVTFSGPATIREEALRLITGIAHQTSVAIESKYLYERKANQERMARELELARGIQARLLPSHLPAPPGWEVAVFWQSAQEVGGDFYDFIEVAPDHLGIVVADVAGKGMPAALYMAVTRSLLRATAPGQINPQPVLTRINQLLVPDTQRGMFVSLFYGVLNTELGLLTYANAGHNPPLHITNAGQTRALRARGLVLGVQPEMRPELGQCQLQPGEGVVFYTDGVTEATDVSVDFFGEERLQDIVRHHWPAGPEAVIDSVRLAVEEFSATSQPADDFTLLVVRRKL